MFVSNDALAVDHNGLGRAIDAPVDADAVVGVVAESKDQQGDQRNKKSARGTSATKTRREAGVEDAVDAVPIAQALAVAPPTGAAARARAVR